MDKTFRCTGWEQEVEIWRCRKCKLYAEEKGIVYNSETGAKIQLTEDMEIKEESTEDTLYYFQMIRIGGYTLLLFYDSGASIGIILGKLAEML